MYREEIALKAKVSLSSVKRVIKDLQEVGILKVYPHIHIKRGGRAHNIYVINPIFEPSEESANEPSSEGSLDLSETVVTRVSDDQRQSHKSLNTNSNKTLKDISKRGEQIDILKKSQKNL